jgi:hypothetical protein
MRDGRRDVLEVRRRAPDETAEADDGVHLPRFRDAPRRLRNLERTWHLVDRDRVARGAAPRQRVERGGQ